MMANPEMDPDKVNIPYVEPETEKCAGVSVADQRRAEAEPVTEPVEPDPGELAAAIASVGATLKTIPAVPAIARQGGMNPPRPLWGVGE